VGVLEASTTRRPVSGSAGGDPRPASARALRALFDLARTHGHASPQGVRIRIPLPQETVAWMVGATRESVNRTLRTLEADGSIRRSGGRYVLLASATHGVEGGSP
jgi:CRP-like cAMP-binding protein